MAELNREQRRRKRFGRGRSTDQAGWPTSQPNPVMERGALEDPVAGQPRQEPTDPTGASTGSATDPPEREPHHEGAHAGTEPKG